MPNNVLNQLRSLRDGVAEELRRDPRYQTLQALDKSIAEITNVLAAAGLLPPGKPASSLSARLSGLGPSMDALAESTSSQQQIAAAPAASAAPSHPVTVDPPEPASHAAATAEFAPTPGMQPVPPATETIKPGFKHGTVGQSQPTVPLETGASLLRPAAGIAAAVIASGGVAELVHEHAGAPTEPGRTAEAVESAPQQNESASHQDESIVPSEHARAHHEEDAPGHDPEPAASEPVVDEHAVAPVADGGAGVHDVPLEPEEEPRPAVDGKIEAEHGAPIHAATHADEHVGETVVTGPPSHVTDAIAADEIELEGAEPQEAEAPHFEAEHFEAEPLAVHPVAEHAAVEASPASDFPAEAPLAGELVEHSTVEDLAVESLAGRSEARTTGYLPMAARADAPKYAPSIAVKFGKLPNKVDLRPLMRPVDDQGEMPTCVADAVASAYECWLKKASKKDQALSRLFVHYNARWRGAQEEDGGTAIQLALEGLQKFGACAETLWPREPGHVLTRPGTEAYQDGAATRIHDMAQVPLKLDAWKQALAEGKPIVFGIALFEPFDACATRGGMVAMPAPGDLAHLRHFLHCLCAVGYSESEKVFIVRNASGSGFGDAGHCYMPYDYVLNPKLNDGDCWVFVPKVPSQPPRETWHDEAVPVADGGRGFGLETETFRPEEYKDVATDLFASVRRPWNPSIVADYGAYASAVNRGAFDELAGLHTASEPETGGAPGEAAAFASPTSKPAILPPLEDGDPAMGLDAHGQGDHDAEEELHAEHHDAVEQARAEHAGG